MPLPVKHFWFLRHGETDYNARGLSQGALDIALNPTGEAQARAAGHMLAGRGITAIVSSPMLRTRQTTALVNETLKLDVKFEPDLREVIFGGMEGQPLHPWFDDWLAGRATPAGAESFAALRKRIERVMPDVLAASGLVLIVAHGGVFRALRDVMALPRDWHTANAVPLLCALGGEGWRVTAADVTADG